MSAMPRSRPVACGGSRSGDCRSVLSQETTGPRGGGSLHYV